MGAFPVRQAIERLRAGLFDPVAVDRLTMEEEAVVEPFAKGLKALEKGQSSHLCICGSYGQGKSHNLTYLQRQALSQGYATSLVQLDIREVPFYQFSVVYQSLMKNLSMPSGESFAARWKKGSLAPISHTISREGVQDGASDLFFPGREHCRKDKESPGEGKDGVTDCTDSPRECEKWGLEVLDDMPHRFRMILQAMLSKNKLPLEKGGVKNRLKPKDFDYWLEEALVGRDLPTLHLKQILKAREVEGYREQPLTARSNATYVQMVQSLGKLLHAMGYKGLVLFFDEAESIAQLRLSARVKSYEILNQFFEYNGFVYPVFAFTETFFDKVRCEEYGGEAPSFPQNYFDAWKNLQIVRLQDSSQARWEALQDRLIALYAEAYQIDIGAKLPEIKQQMGDLLEKLKMQETRFKLKALINQLDIICIRTAS